MVTSICLNHSVIIPIMLPLIQIKEMMYSLLQKHLRCLRNESNRFSPDLNYLDTKFLRNPFNIDVASLPDSLLEDFMDFTRTQ